MTDNPTPPDATGSQAQEREALDHALRTLDSAARQFAFYADEHTKKGTREGDQKARTNTFWANACRAPAAGRTHLPSGAGPLREALYAAKSALIAHTDDYTLWEQELLQAQLDALSLRGDAETDANITEQTHADT